jgi:hypothetical protein
MKPRRLLARPGHIFRVAAAILMDALGRQFQHAIRERRQEVAIVADELPPLSLPESEPLDILLDITPENSMSSSQKRAIQNYRSRLGERGLPRFEVLGRDADRDLIRSFARHLVEGGPEASQLRAAVSQTIAGEPPRKGGILAALRRSPMAGTNLDLTRSRKAGRKVDL